MCRHYVAIKKSDPSLEEQEVLRRMYVMRIAAQTIFGGPEVYRELKSKPDHIDLIVQLNPDLLALIRCAVFQEHPEFHRQGTPPDRFDVLDGVLNEVIKREVPSWQKPDTGVTVVDGSSFTYTALPMVWTAWHNGSHHNPFTGFGFKISEVDRDLYFTRSWKKVTIALPVGTGFVLTEANIDKESFWGDCRELITKDIGVWMMAQKYAPWGKGLPPKFMAHLVSPATFEVELYKNKPGTDTQT